MAVDWDAVARQVSGTEPCPTPSKRQFVSRKKIKAFIAHAPNGDQMWYYECGCGFWHLTSKRPSEHEA